MTDRLFSDCCYGTDDQHGPSDPCPNDPIRVLEAVMRNPLARTALDDKLYKRIIRITAACGRIPTSAEDADGQTEAREAYLRRLGDDMAGEASA